MKNYLVTGGCGFIGSYVVKKLLENKNNFIYVIDKMGIGSSHDNIINGHPRINYIFRDIAAICIKTALPTVKIDYVINLAAESHVDRSIKDSAPFVQSNVTGTVNVLDYVKSSGARMVHVSTDEVYGHLQISEPPFRESDSLQPRSPYAASKAAADLFVLSYYKTYNIDVSITRCCNNYGPRQHDEKLIPTIIRSIISGKKVPIYGNGMNIREWIHAEDHAAAIIEVLYMNAPGTIFNIPGSKHLANIDITSEIIKIVEKQLPKVKRVEGDYIEFVDDRAGHDFRYAVATQYNLEAVDYQRDFCLEDTVAHYIKKYI